MLLYFGSGLVFLFGSDHFWRPEVSEPIDDPLFAGDSTIKRFCCSFADSVLDHAGCRPWFGKTYPQNMINIEALHRRPVIVLCLILWVELHEDSKIWLQSLEPEIPAPQRGRNWKKITASNMNETRQTRHSQILKVSKTF